MGPEVGPARQGHSSLDRLAIDFPGQQPINQSTQQHVVRIKQVLEKFCKNSGKKIWKQSGRSDFWSIQQLERQNSRSKPARFECWDRPGCGRSHASIKRSWCHRRRAQPSACSRRRRRRTRRSGILWSLLCWRATAHCCRMQYGWDRAPYRQ